MLRLLTSLLLLLFIEGSCFSQQAVQKDFSRVDSIVYNYGDARDLTIDSVTHFVNSAFTSDTDKVRAYYIWICSNINYDVPLMETMSHGGDAEPGSQDADVVFANRLGVCEGYAKLMKKLCDASAIPCEVVPGYSKASHDEMVMDLFHAWNAIKIDGHWQLLDVTWASNYMMDEDGTYLKEFNGKYFMDNPEEFMKDHLPLDPMWQLSASPLTKEGFFQNTGENIRHFSYADSITAYLQKDKAGRRYLDVVHYHNFDPDNKRFARSVDVIHNNTAAKLLLSATKNYLTYVDFFTNEFSSKNASTDCKKANEMLLESKRDLTRALAYLEGKKALTEEFRKNFDEIRSTAQTNLEMINWRLEVLQKFEKKLTVASAAKKK